MSGGSYNYLHRKNWGNHIDWEHDLDKMVERLTELGYEDAAEEAYEELLEIRRSKVRINSIHKRLSNVYKAVEWVDSGDSGKDRIEEAIREYREDEATKEAI